MGIGNRLPDEALSTPSTNEPKVEKAKKEQPSVNFVPEEPKYELGDIILPQGVRDDNFGCRRLCTQQQDRI